MHKNLGSKGLLLVVMGLRVRGYRNEVEWITQIPSNLVSNALVEILQFENSKMLTKLTSLHHFPRTQLFKTKQIKTSFFFLSFLSFSPPFFFFLFFFFHIFFLNQQFTKCFPHTYYFATNPKLTLLSINNNLKLLTKLLRKGRIVFKFREWHLWW